MTNHQEPDAAFADHLEWQLRTEWRRKQRFQVGVAVESNFKGLARVGRIAALILACFVCGAASVVAAERYQGRSQREIELARVQMNLEFAGGAVELLEQQVQEVRAWVEQGRGANDGLIAAERDLQLGRVKLDLAQLDYEEASLTGQAPRREVTAALVASKDFVSERLVLEARAQGVALEAAEKMLQRAKALFDAGVSSRDELAALEMEVRLARIELDGVQRLVDLRRSYLSGKLTAEETFSRAQIAKALQQVESAAVVAEESQRRMSTVRMQVEAGSISARELSALELESRKKQAELRFAQLRLESLQR